MRTCVVILKAKQRDAERRRESGRAGETEGEGE